MLPVRANCPVGDIAVELLTHTKRRDFQNCRRYFLHRHVQHLTPRFQKGGRRRGSAFGAAIFAVNQDALESQHTSGEQARPLEDIVQEAVGKVYANQEFATPEELGNSIIEMTKVEIMAVGYIRRYGTSERRELEFDLPLVNPRTGYSSRAYRRAGKIDGIVIQPGHHALVIEDKLVGSIQQAMIDRLPLDHQVTEYVDALLAKGWTAEVLYRHTRFPQTNPVLVGTKATGGRRRETVDEFTTRLSEDVLERPDHYFDQQRLLFPQDHIDDYRHGRWGVAQQIIQARRDAKRLGETVAYPMNPSRCWEYGGCEFIPLCTKREGAESLYTLAPDNPELSRKDDDGTTSEYPAAAH